MKTHTLFLLPVCCLGLCACQTTGDPNEGGLFGWSQKKADERIAERETTLTEEQQAARREQGSAETLRREVRLTSADLRGQRAELSQLLADTEALEREAPTPAGASRARDLHRHIDAVRMDETLSTDARWMILRRYSAEVDVLRAQFAGH